MSVHYNSNDDMWYGTNSDRMADTIVIKQPTAKWYEFDTGNIYITDGTQWHIM